MGGASRGWGRGRQARTLPDAAARTKADGAAGAYAVPGLPEPLAVFAFGPCPPPWQPPPAHRYTGSTGRGRGTTRGGASGAARWYDPDARSGRAAAALRGRRRRPDAKP